MISQFKIKLHTQIFLGILIGLFVGIIFRENAVVLKPIGDLFIRMLRMIIIPIVFASLVVGIMNLGSIQNLGRLGSRTFGYFLSTTLIAVIIGLTMVNIIKPGMGTDISFVQSVPFKSENISAKSTFLSVLNEVVPENIVEAMAQENMLGVIFFSVVFGSALLVVGKKSETIFNAIEGLNDVVLKITDWIMYLAPIGVFAIMASFIGTTGLSAIKPLALYVATVLISIIIHVLITYSSFLIVVAKYSPVSFVKKMFPAIATAFSTDSSVATIPVTIECLEKRVGISSKVASFVAPLGATLNMDGTAMYEAIAAMFIAQLYGIEMTLIQQLIIFITASLASIGAAGIPSAGLVTMVIVLQAVNLPLEAIGLLLAVDRILDMCRTTVNVMGDSCGSIVIAKMEGERVSG